MNARQRQPAVRERLRHYGAPNKQVVHEIQRALGQEPCFLTDARYSCQNACEWSDDCQSLRAEWLR